MSREEGPEGTIKASQVLSASSLTRPWSSLPSFWLSPGLAVNPNHLEMSSDTKTNATPWKKDCRSLYLCVFGKPPETPGGPRELPWKPLGVPLEITTKLLFSMIPMILAITYKVSMIFQPP